jgi:hypothetical protein
MGSGVGGSSDILIPEDSGLNDNELFGVTASAKGHPARAESGYADPNVDTRVIEAQERLTQLREEAEKLEREKVLLETLRRRQQEFLNGRGEMTDRLSRAIAQLDREGVDCERKIEQLRLMREAFADHLEAVNSLTPEDWKRCEMDTELARALAVISDARAEYERCMTRLQMLTHSPAPEAAPAAAALPGMTAVLPMGTDWASFRRWAFYGLAFSTPAVALALILGLLWRLIF